MLLKDTSHHLFLVDFGRFCWNLPVFERQFKKCMNCTNENIFGWTAQMRNQNCGISFARNRTTMCSVLKWTIWLLSMGCSPSSILVFFVTVRKCLTSLVIGTMIFIKYQYCSCCLTQQLLKSYQLFLREQFQYVSSFTSVNCN